MKFRFKALQHIVEISATLPDKADNMLAKMKQLLKLINKVARNDVTDAINSILDAVTKCENPDTQKKLY